MMRLYEQEVVRNMSEPTISGRGRKGHLIKLAGFVVILLLIILFSSSWIKIFQLEERNEERILQTYQEIADSNRMMLLRMNDILNTDEIDEINEFLINVHYYASQMLTKSNDSELEFPDDLHHLYQDLYRDTVIMIRSSQSNDGFLYKTELTQWVMLLESYWEALDYSYYDDLDTMKHKFTMATAKVVKPYFVLKYQ